ncbi:MAG TPA: bifunctional diaminohydroxyphosphoribosylaminopyrimidine deaminase/5-amino-6-(5-phosphoribosylamino)uracil reductase RibD [Usitatibacter sp.]|jgi:diaminohydroxyphosphoribosylaminopyrimidine deaminase/5-amino-6-(5-phosphoribosylamino)uracil reductase|nr:bifunctional diaminohydroxyphosphoribosylaminopyrimidine deaminase/5-amino-6-(5-phosphoribosylamino)uracil reductase RibD [Usitatibacter sp.]
MTTTATWSGTDLAFMARALALTERGRDTCTPNPNVGCVLAKGGRVIGEGWHERAGEAHAEVRALQAATESPEGATAYVTLEPCAHHGRTGPCAEALVKARVARVVAALEDPNPEVAGRGFARLREAGIAVDVGLMADEAREAHRGFLSRMQRGRPWLRVKAASSLDGRIALSGGESRWITGEEARRDVHRLRARSCAMLTGIGTVRQDDPELTVRHVPCSRQPRRVVIDNRLEMPLTAKILAGAPPLILTVSDDKAKRASLEAKGAEVVRVPGEGKSDLAAVAKVLGDKGFNEVTAETGGKLMGSLIAAGVVDELVIYYAGLILGDEAQALFVLPEPARLSEALRPRIVDVRSLGGDFRVTARFGA